MNTIVRNVLIIIVAFCLGAASMYYSGPDKKTTTDAAESRQSNTKDQADIEKQSDEKETKKSNETIKRETKLPDGTIISEDIVRDYWVEKVSRENIVMKENIEKIEKENIELHQIITEKKKSSVRITIMPTYRFSNPFSLNSIDYTFMAQKHVFWECYLGVSLDKYMVGIPLTCDL